jgi:hypothetical protein
MDALGTLSILLDITWISQYFAQGSANQAQILRATRAAKLGARYGRLMRILKLMRFVQFLPCFAKGEEDIAEPTTSSIRRIVNQLNNALSIRVAFIVMTLVIVMPFLVYVEQTDYQVAMAWLTAIKVLAKDSTKSKNDILALVSKFQSFYSSKDAKLHSITIQSPFFADPISKEFVTRDYLRLDNIVPFSKDYLYNGARYKLKVELDLTKGHQEDSLYGIIIILLVMVLLVGGASSLQSAVDGIIVIPMEKLSNTLRNSATVMLKSMKVVQEEKKKQDGAGNEDDDEDDEGGELETQMLEKMVEKLARIAATMAPAQMGIGDDMKNVDKDTTTWLTTQYSNLSRVFVHEESKSTSVQSLKARSSTNIDSIVSTDIINSWSLDVLDYKHDQLIEIWVWIFGSLNVYEEFSFTEDKLKGFLFEISNRYVNDNTYHNFKHGCDVGHTVYRLLMSSGLNQVFNHLEVFCMLVAAIGHDVGHPGVNNPYLVKAKHELALKFNDRSPLENMHCTVIYEVLKKDKCNIFSGLSEPQWRDARKLILTTVLGTDMAHHFEQISKTQLFLEVNGEDVHKFCAGEKNTIDALAQEKDRLFILEVCLHCADISNPYKPWKVCERWAHLVIEEFARQGDREKSEGLEISPMCDRATINLCNSQLGFIEFVVAPLIIGACFSLSFSLASPSLPFLLPPLVPPLPLQHSSTFFHLSTNAAATWQKTCFSGVSGARGTSWPTKRLPIRRASAKRWTSELANSKTSAPSPPLSLRRVSDP